MKMENGKGKTENWSAKRLALLIGVVAISGMLASGCSDKSSEPTREAHPAGWADTSSADFHGKYLEARGLAAGVANCRECHGADSSNLATGFSCYGCHKQFPHPAGWSGPASANIHQIAIQQAHWNIQTCKACHGADFTAVKVKADSSLVSCITCHSGQGGPENCATCHGSPDSPAPPKDLLGGATTDLMTVGAHQVHLNGRRVTKGIACGECHAPMSNYDDPKHIDTTTVGVAEVTFGMLATDSSRVTPVWDQTTGSCSSVYCHGSFDGGNDSNQVYWTRGESQAECGTCHSFPPPAPHVQTGACTTCHFYNITTKHVNGVVDMR